jgi:putative endonuclease
MSFGWHAISSVSFHDDQRAIDFERYLKSDSGNAFANKRLW